MLDPDEVHRLLLEERLTRRLVTWASQDSVLPLDRVLRDDTTLHSHSLSGTVRPSS